MYVYKEINGEREKEGEETFSAFGCVYVNKYMFVYVCIRGAGMPVC